MMNNSLRHTKIVVTLGPALDNEDLLRQALLAGVNIFRANFSHGDATAHATRINLLRKLAAESGIVIAILADMQGPKIRIGRFKNNMVQLHEGDNFILDPNLANDAGTELTVSLDYKNLPQDVSVDDILLLDDGRLTMVVQQVIEQRIYCKVLVGGQLSNNKGINRLGGGLSAGAITSKDCQDIKAAAALDVDFVAISFPRSGADIDQARQLLRQAGSNANIIAKIERTEAISNLVDILKTADGIMIARGDLGVEVGDAELPGIQKNIIRQAKLFAKPVITATQMLESMINSKIPTRAEVSDVANAVLDASDAVMLSAETASGNYPIKAIAAMDRICLSAEKYLSTKAIVQQPPDNYHRVDHAIAEATMFTANHLNIKAIIALTESGTTPLLMSRVYSSIPIYGLSRHQETLRRMTLYRGVYPIQFDATSFDRRELNYAAVDAVKKAQLLQPGDLVIITKGDSIGVHGCTNSMKIVTVGEICTFLP
jgi:pyruvate kinase